MAGDIEREAARVRDLYARRPERGLDARYQYWQPANLFIYQSRERDLLRLLRTAGRLPLGERRILDVGCGDGRVLSDILRYGALPADVYGIDLLPDRVERARQVLPAAHLEVGDAQSLPFDAAAFDVVLGFTLFSSVIDTAARRRVASEMARVTKPGGLIVLYDFWTNPLNRHVRPMRRREVSSLFPEKRIAYQGTTLAPPLARLLIKAPGGWLACSVLEMLPFLRTHYLAAIHI